MNTFKIATDDTLRETIRHGSGGYPFAYYPEDIWQFDFHRIDWHWHHELEFMVVTDGTACCLVGQDTLEISKGSGIFINSGILHRFEASGSTLIPNIVFSPVLLAPEKSLVYEKYIQPVITSSTSYQVFRPQTAWQNQILQILTQVFVLEETEQKNELHTVQLLFQMWGILFKNLDFASDSTETRRLNHQKARLQAMMQFVHDHYTEELTLEKIAGAASVSKSSALHIFKSYIHIPPVAYLVQYRLSQAAWQLQTTAKSITSIAEETGFTTAGYFCRKFRQHYGMSPNEYRNNTHRNKPTFIERKR